MKVQDVMSSRVDLVFTDTSVREVSRLIFGKGVNGVPVCNGKKIVGFITERDILAKFYPSMQEYIEDPVHFRDFEDMEKRVAEVLSLTADKIMSKNPIMVSLDAPLLKAQSIMFIQKVGRLPVVDKKLHLVGILSKGDIFRTIVGGELEKEESFYDWMAGYYDVFNDWDQRLFQELPNLIKLLKREKVRKVIDVGSSTGEHIMALAKDGFELVGLDASAVMHKYATKKREKLLEKIKGKVKFIKGNYRSVTHQLDRDFDCAIFMGDALAHVKETDPNIIENIAGILKERKSMMIFQIINMEKIFKKNNGFKDFVVRDLPGNHKIAFLTYYTRRKKGKNNISTRAVFEFDGEKWSEKGVHTKKIVEITKESLQKTLEKLGFSKITFYGSDSFDLFKGKFDPKESDWLNVVAKR
ncbi:MAG: hypothetical protein CO135_03985 [Candidatus Levybacteria bacterium CG_4_9_14_3_um_filter_35_16]|nr:MAG: hypothetical protein COW87_04265 [Candidatus Levybacteria bacterium CG22_combo_CG10-13_8_21_14_all_35_11]PIY94958.1 MAG: hypothetical protein COY68_00880 [Candidatus Levybacteria bacterium CG_4_10_14_0_8_um_filter_35_23]PJA90844.1 MAG: hypothetical protein CO135_03985 [Candidatus Levybacteria bacterium CG_4_9_14_3_um_filter_35_16]PJC54171.1 MAG: hypothetical protein CO028_03815 [Candidatus Levybacteria bacterium CG_4_9_14_0_2_um_filter_35_21]